MDNTLNKKENYGILVVSYLSLQWSVLRYKENEDFSIRIFIPWSVVFACQLAFSA